ncbi:DUF1553 domain-containing protein [Haloferula helveola]|uniref:DUF1553 domain-containing protein n=1 Tax=Haloferula helveola TaxID=490095 RepID=A0ABM7RD35_9BACT|nr:DUF1553 domain-containing protein [Haloferula helveola]
MDPKHQHLISAYLDGSLTPEEARMLNDLLRNDPEARAELLRQSEAHETLKQSTEAPAAASSETVVPFPGEAPERPRFRHWPAVAAAAVVIAALGVGIGVTLNPVEPVASKDAPVDEKPRTPEEAYSETLAKLPEAGSLKRPAANSDHVPVVLPGEKLSYNQHIRPILSENCFHCHGPDSAKREADLALHDPELAYAPLDGDLVPIVPGDASRSEVVRRIFDHDDPMPPVDSNRSLTEAQKKLVQRWIEEGAVYEEHWAFIPPAKAELPQLEAEAPVRNPIDRFVQRKLAEKELQPSPEAPKEVAARRATLALTGLQPTPEQMEEFLADTRPDAYEHYVDGLLSSDAYAERMALFWMDAARYADTDGYQNDGERTNWPWRDWVIAAYRDNMPFDQFTIEQLAGDMLPDATDSQRLATAFNRNHRQNGEGGALAEEFFVENVIDRVETTSTLWLGLTTGCARCHDHKYDPISQREFYEMFAYFNSIGERGIGAGKQAQPMLTTASPLRKEPEDLNEKVAEAKGRLAALEDQTPGRIERWITASRESFARARNEWVPVEEIASAEVTGDEGKLIVDSDGSLLFEGQNVGDIDYTIRIPIGDRAITGVRIDMLTDPTFGAPRKLARSVNGNFVLTDLRVSAGAEKPSPVAISSVSATFQQDRYPVDAVIDGNPKSGWAVFGPDVKAEAVSLFAIFQQPATSGDGALVLTMRHLSGFADHNPGRFRIYLTERPLADRGGIGAVPADVLAAVLKDEPVRTAGERQTIRNFFETIDPDLVAAREQLTALEKKAENAGGGKVAVMVMNEQKQPTPAYLLDRGQYDAPDKSEVLPRGLPKAIHPGNDMPGDRLELARWLVSRENPLTARVVVNRMWQRLFGVGLVKTSEDFGSQAELPSHPELLDWLAVEFIDSGWDTKALYRLIATSHTFRQSSKSNSVLNELDPENRLLARGPRYRMDGFAIRDLALHSAGLLNTELGGPPVKPYQPAGLWQSVANSPNVRYQPAKGADLYRKSLYTYWKRAVNPPRQIIFDASGREICNVRNKITNTPLQALALMNDETFLEAARHVAARMIREGGATPEERLKLGYRLVTGYEPDDEELAVFERNRAHFADHFADNPAEAADFISIGESPRDATLDPVEHAAYTAAAHLMLNLDETITLE